MVTLVIQFIKYIMKGIMNKPGNIHLDHVAIEVKDLKEALDFYINVIGLDLLDTPESVREKGVQWIKLNERQAIHLVESSDASPGKISHIALEVDDVKQWKTRIEEKGIDIDPPKFNMYRAERFFVLDPSKNRIEFLKWNS
jgi:catechol 2,3-dioxygenase-like lactoylglutathione lyase family enzyme